MVRTRPTLIEPLHTLSLLEVMSHPVQSNKSLIASLRSLTDADKWPEFDALEVEFNRCFDATSEDARQLREHESLVQAMQLAEAGVRRALETKTRWAAAEMARVKRVQMQADAMMAEARVMRVEAGEEMKRARAVEDEGESDISRHEDAVASIKGRLGRISRERRGRCVAQQRWFKAAVGRLWQTVDEEAGGRLGLQPLVNKRQAQLQPAKVQLPTPMPLRLLEPSHQKKSDTTSHDSSEEKIDVKFNPSPAHDRPTRRALSISQLLIDTKEEPSSAISRPSPTPFRDRIQLPVPESHGQFYWPLRSTHEVSPLLRDPLFPLGLSRPDINMSSCPQPSNIISHQKQFFHQDFSTERKEHAFECMPKPNAPSAMTTPQVLTPGSTSTGSFSSASCSPLSTPSSLSHIPTALSLTPPTRSFPPTSRPSVPPLPQPIPPTLPTTGQIPFRRKHNTIPPLPSSWPTHKQSKQLPNSSPTDHWDPSHLNPEAGLLGSVTWEQFYGDGAKYPLYKRWLCQRRQRVRGLRGMHGPPRWLVFKCSAHPAHVIDSQKELERHYRREHADVKTGAQRLRECAVHVRGCRLALASSHNSRISSDTYAADWGSEGVVPGGGCGGWEGGE